MNIVLYLRFSSHSQNEASIEGQLRECEKYAEIHNMKILSTYIDRAQTATNDKRDEFQRMIADSAKRQFDAILVYQLDRFARSRYDSAHYKSILRKNGVKVISARETITEDASGVLMEAVLEGLNEYYSVELSQKIRRGMDLNAEKCLCTGGNIALGYRVDNDKRFQINTSTAPIVQKVFEMYAAGRTVKQITDYMNEQQIKTSRGNPFNKNSLRVMLQNKRYIGIYTYHKKEIPNGMPRIISDSLFMEVQEIMNKNKKAPARARAKEEYLLTTKLFCGYDKEMMVGVSGTSRTGKIHNYYTCKDVLNKKGCKKKNVRKQYIEELVLKHAKSQLTDEKIAIIAEETEKLCKQENDKPNLYRLNKLLKENAIAIENLLKAIEQGKHMDLISERITLKQKEKAELEKQIATEKMQDIGITANEVKFFLTALKKGDSNDLKYQKALITIFINSIFLYDDKITIVFNTSDRPVSIDVDLLDNEAENDGSYIEDSARPFFP